MAVPNISPYSWNMALRPTIDEVSDFFQRSQQLFNRVPDERGLTDQLLLGLARRGNRINTVTITPAQEAQLGYDYTWEFNFQDSMGVWHYKKVFLQAKSYKRDAQNRLYADFTYQNAQGYQIILLDQTIQTNAWALRNQQAGPGSGPAVVIGGYLLYGPDTLQYIPVGRVRERYEELRTATPTLSAARANQELALTFYDDEWELGRIYTSMG